MWGRFRVGVLIVVGTGIAQISTVSLADPGAGTGAAARGAPALRALDKPAFTATPAELLALGKAAPTGRRCSGTPWWSASSAAGWPGAWRPR